MTDQELIDRAREVAPRLSRRRGDVDRLAGALLAELAGRLADHKAALELHQPITRREGWSRTCSYDNHRWPCPEVATLISTLTERLRGAQGDDG